MRPPGLLRPSQLEGLRQVPLAVWILLGLCASIAIWQSTVPRSSAPRNDPVPLHLSGSCLGRKSFTNGTSWKAYGSFGQEWDDMCSEGLPSVLTSLIEIRDGDERYNQKGAVGRIVSFVNTSTPHAVTMTTCNKCGCDICGFIHASGVFAPSETLIFDHVLSTACSDDGLVVDIGGNIGYFTTMAATYGCHVVAFEPQRGPARLAKASVLANQVCDKVKWVPTAVGPSIDVVLPFNGAWGLTKLQDNMSAVAEKDIRSVIHTLPIEKVVSGRVVLLKADTEGFEGLVFKDTKAIFGSVSIDNIVVEVKDRLTPEKRGMLQRIFQDGGFTHVYSYFEHYGMPLTGVIVHRDNRDWTLADSMVEVTAVVAKGPDSTEDTPFEDFWFRKEPYAPYVELQRAKEEKAAAEKAAKAAKEAAATAAAAQQGGAQTAAAAA